VENITCTVTEIADGRWSASVRNQEQVRWTTEYDTRRDAMLALGNYLTSIAKYAAF
jgi:hypothetical protein